ncbi:hypothetical protein CONPUDRAFT_119568 [Coniophora puteana RWD-64-598 SS2]|uniref:Uncharacterized protein n=1 Tax=Coniophora puteana (strain RWD-64-598) TaxID=741705 RepID=A0A5M3MY47_CONPW|nr:uncharacterized protein CONPUDRAFT_119568 [Coniophora puteana RWD-64-598 SS2]EIW84019.1 hypothetical protein CONPUDRAFT_119568 [Coniophora puteana RWD-64-598 SS2]
MCSMECFGDQYRGCGHYVRVYQTGITYDCKQPQCKLSSAHMHKTARNCGCNTEYADHRRVQNLFQTKCEACQIYEEELRAAEFRKLGRHRQ